MHRLLYLTAAALAAVATAFAQAQDYPSHPMKLVLPQPPGGIIDLLSRSLGERLSEQMKQPVIVENMPGANGSLAAAQVMRAPADGYTLFMAVDTNLVVNPNLYPNLPYDSFRDFTPVSVLAKVPLVLVANPKVPANGVRELIEFAKAHPGKLNYASIGLGTQSHLGMELLKIMTGIDINQVSYRGTAPAMTDVVAGEVDVMFTGPPSASAMSADGKLKILATGGKQRLALMPDVPTLDESGVPGYELTGWFGMVAPARTHGPVLERLGHEVRKAVADSRFKERMAAQGLEIVGSSPAEMTALMQADTRKWAEVINKTGARIAQ
jgi:tripartite-type tricarboxylate transporter receptor subunit TctC